VAKAVKVPSKSKRRMFTFIRLSPEYEKAAEGQQSSTNLG
jgi:hypothetical protein